MPEVALSPGVFIPLPGAPRLALPLDEVRVSAGFPSPAADYEDKRLDINEYPSAARQTYLLFQGLKSNPQ